MSYFYVACTILLTVYSQLVIKWQVIGAGAFPADAADKLWFLTRLLVNPWVLSALAALLVTVSGSLNNQAEHNTTRTKARLTKG
jgi:hypothetical protein